MTEETVRLLSARQGLFWRDRAVWKTASWNTMWCLIGCSIGDMGTILFFQLSGIPWPALAIMGLAMVNGILTSIALETAILWRQMAFRLALRTAAGMSLLSMIGMETAMNGVDLIATGGAKLTLWVLPLMWGAGFVTPLPYNYWRLKALGQACH